LLEAMQDGVIVLAEDGIILYGNPAFAAMSQVEPETLPGRFFGKFIDRDSVRRFWDLMGASARGSAKDIVELLGRQGRRFPASLTISRVTVGDRDVRQVVVADLTEQQIAESHELEHSMTSEVLDQARDAILVCDRYGQIVRFNNAAVELLGPDVLLGDFQEMLRLDNAGLAISIRDILDGDTREAMPATVQGVSGERRSVLLSATALRSGTRAWGVVFTLTDISPLLEAQEFLKKSEAYYRTIFSNSIDAILVVDGSGQVLDANPVAYELFGFDRGQRFHIPAEWIGAQAAGRLVADPGGERTIFDWTYHRSDGAALHLSVRASAFDYMDGPVFMVAARDMSGRHLAEDRLAASEARYRAIFEHTGTATAIVERDTSLLTANRQFENMSGYVAGELRTKRLVELIHPDDVEQFMRRFRPVFEGRRTVLGEAEFRLIDDKGNVLDIMCSFGKMPELEHAVVSLIDVSMERVYEKALEERARQLSDFMSIAAHELNIPVTIMKGYAQTLARHIEELPGPTLQEILQNIEEGSNRLEHLVREMLDVSRIETGRMRVEMGEVELDGALRRAVREIEARGAGNLFRIRMDGAIDKVKGDPEKLNQVLLILLDNALRYSPPSSLIELEVAAHRDDAVVSVLDRGIGIPEGERQHVFEPFAQVEDVEHHSRSGLGLGLYIGREIVQAHGGKIWAESREGGGTVFRFTLPLEEKPE
jgi:PAS domain S-box-containing protein